MRVAIVVGTRPEIIKMSPIIRAAVAQENVEPLVWHTGQHYSFEMDRQIFNDLELPYPDTNLHIGSGTHAAQTGTIMAQLEALMLRKRPDVVLVQGDTNTVLGASLAAVKLHIPVGHVEAGLRSYDRAMPEEINRIVCDHIADVLYPPTEPARDILYAEGIPQEKIVVTGNTAVDAALQGLELAKQKSHILDSIAGPYVFFTMHRAENVDSARKLGSVMRALERLLERYQDLNVAWPLHPRTRKQLELFKLSEKLVGLPHLHITQPLGYLDTLLLESRAALVMTDSGGIQEETCIFGVPCVTLRENTERPESVAVGANELAGTSSRRIMAAANRRLRQKVRPSWENPFGDGHAGERIITDLMQRLQRRVPPRKRHVKTPRHMTGTTKPQVAR